MQECACIPCGIPHSAIPPKVVTAEPTACLQVRVTVLRGLLSRAFAAWRRLADDRWWKTQLGFRDREIELLERKALGFRNRPIVMLRKRRLSQCLAGAAVQLDAGCVAGLARIACVAGFLVIWLALQHIRRVLCGTCTLRHRLQSTQSTTSRAAAGWKAQAQRLRRKRLRWQRAVAKFRNRELAAAWTTWFEYTNVRPLPGGLCCQSRL